jgi:glycosyltransferase involved in cell wall biosynthesis
VSVADLSKLKLCFVAGTLDHGGAERQLFYILKALRQSGADVRLLTLTKGEFWEDRIRALGVPVKFIGQSSAKPLRLSHLLRELRRNPPTILQSQHFYTNLYVSAAARMLSLKDIGAIRNDGHSEVGCHGRIFGRLSLRTPSLLAANSRSGMRNVESLGVPGSRVYLLPNVIDTEHFTPAPRAEGQPFQVLGVGRLVTQKRFDRFLRVVAALKNSCKRRVKATIVGAGPDEAILREKALSMELGPDVLEFKGTVNDMRAVYQNADLFLLTSDWEGTPNVLLEAMASGMAVVSTNVGGVADIVQHGENGFRFNTSDEKGMIDGIRTLIGHDEVRKDLARSARRFVIDEYSLHRLPHFLGGLYQAALRG